MMKKQILIILSLLIGLPLFLFVHELGHFTAAEFYGYEPEMKFRADFSPYGAYVVYDTAQRDFMFSDGVIAISGAIATLILTLFFVPLFFMKDANLYFIGIIFCILGISMTIAPLLPFPGTDGFKIAYYLLEELKWL